MLLARSQLKPLSWKNYIILLCCALFFTKKTPRKLALREFQAQKVPVGNAGMAHQFITAALKSKSLLEKRALMQHEIGIT